MKQCDVIMFISMTLLGSTVTPVCHTGQSKGRYRAHEASILFLSLLVPCSKVIKGIPKPLHTKILIPKYPHIKTSSYQNPLYQNLLTTKPPYTKFPHTKISSYQNLLLLNFPHTKTSSYQNPSYQNLLTTQPPYTKFSSYQNLLIPKPPHTMLQVHIHEHRHQQSSP